jgi:hypothetical protein
MRPELTCIARDSQASDPIDNITCPYHAVFRCTQTFDTAKIALVHASAHLEGKGRRTCPYEIQFECSYKAANLRDAQRHTFVHMKEKPKRCPACKKSIAPTASMRKHQMSCKVLQVSMENRGVAEWEIVMEKNLALPEWELEKAYLCIKTEEWKM